jgi:uncharacterized protein (TIGR00299 family) protein
MRTLYFDCFCGASGDMIVGALLDAGADFGKLRAALESLGVGGFTVSAEKIKKHGIMATQFRVEVEHEHGHPHRHLHDILEIIERGELPVAVKEASGLTFRSLAECEAAVHGSTIEEVHFHEVGAVDSIVDIVSAHWALNDLGVESVSASPLNVGSGTIHTAHGVLPVPAPATARLLEGVPSYGSEVALELVTPTGAALITQCAQAYGAMPEMRIGAIGYGAGTKDLSDRANVLRVLVGETDGAVPVGEFVTVIEANIDDMNPELVPPLLAGLIERGARDAFVTPIVGKKGRPAFLITVLADAEHVDAVVSGMFHESTTLGVRIRQERRVCLERAWQTVETPWGAVRVKIGRFQGQITCRSPEFEDCRRLAEEKGVPVLAVYERAKAAAVELEIRN